MASTCWGRSCWTKKWCAQSSASRTATSTSSRGEPARARWRRTFSSVYSIQLRPMVSAAMKPRTLSLATTSDPISGPMLWAKTRIRDGSTKSYCFKARMPAT